MSDSVWIVREDSSLDYEGWPNVSGVFETQEEAEEAANVLAKHADKYTSYEVEEWSFADSRTAIAELKARKRKRS